MTESNQTQGPPSIQLDTQGDLITGALADVIDWFLNYDSRVVIIRHLHVESVFQWKQADSLKAKFPRYIA